MQCDDTMKMLELGLGQHWGTTKTELLCLLTKVTDQKLSVRHLLDMGLMYGLEQTVLYYGFINAPTGAVVTEQVPINTNIFRTTS